MLFEVTPSSVPFLLSDVLVMTFVTSVVLFQKEGDVIVPLHGVLAA